AEFPVPLPGMPGAARPRPDAAAEAVEQVARTSEHPGQAGVDVTRAAGRCRFHRCPPGLSRYDHDISAEYVRPLARSSYNSMRPQGVPRRQPAAVHRAKLGGSSPGANGGPSAKTGDFRWIDEAGSWIIRRLRPVLAAGRCPAGVAAEPASQ